MKNSIIPSHGLNRGHVEFLQINEIDPQGHDFGAFNPGLRTKVLSGHPAYGSTLLVQAAPNWCFPYEFLFSSEIEILVLSGELEINGKLLSTGFYAFIEPRTKIKSISSSKGAKILWMANGSADWIIDDISEAKDKLELTIVDTNEILWHESPPYKGRDVNEVVPGLFVKLIRQDPITSAYTLMTRHEPGWIDPRLETHDTWEELLLIQGEYLMGTTGQVCGGSYIFRPSTRPHGPQATISGALWFCRGEKEIDFQYHDEGWVDEHVKRYLKCDDEPQMSSYMPWGNWWDGGIK